MGRSDDPYRLGWRFWLRLLLIALATSSASEIFRHFDSKPFRLDFFPATMLINFLGWLGPTLAVHYHNVRKNLGNNLP